MQLEFTALDIAEKIKFNDDRLAMEKIIVILKSDRYEYIREKVFVFPLFCCVLLHL